MSKKLKLSEVLEMVAKQTNVNKNGSFVVSHMPIYVDVVELVNDLINEGSIRIREISELEEEITKIEEERFQAGYDWDGENNA